jgi:hypothetical protein
MNLHRLIRDRLRDALRSGEAGGEAKQTNAAISYNVGGSGHKTTVYSDGHVTIIERDGERQVIHHAPGETES